MVKYMNVQRCGKTRKDAKRPPEKQKQKKISKKKKKKKGWLILSERHLFQKNFLAISPSHTSTWYQLETASLHLAI